MGWLDITEELKQFGDDPLIADALASGDSRCPHRSNHGSNQLLATGAPSPYRAPRLCSAARVGLARVVAAVWGINVTEGGVITKHTVCNKCSH